LGHKADAIKNDVLHYEGTLSNDCAPSGESGEVELFRRDIANWAITFVETGLDATVGQRLEVVRGTFDDVPFPANQGNVMTGTLPARASSGSSPQTESPR
jgi:glucose-1-phosphate cytidylyltransferase